MIKCYLGCMFSGKTSAMLDEIDKANIAGLRTLVIKYSEDNRYCESFENKIITHSKREYNSGKVIATSNLLDVAQMIHEENIQVIGIDEFQFMHFASYAIDWSLEGRDVYIAALDGDFEQKIFKNVAHILPYADEIIKLKAVCMKCFARNSAVYTERTSNETERIVIGGDDKYIAVCKKCIKKLTPKRR